MNSTSIPIDVSISNITNIWGTKNLYCTWSLDLEKFKNTGDLIMSYYDNVNIFFNF